MFKNAFFLLSTVVSFSLLASVDVFRSADRPQLTEKPHTVGKGLFQIEANVFGYGYERDGDYRVHSVDLATVEANYGLNEVIDLFVGFTAFHYYNPNRRFDNVNIAASSESGIGDLKVGAEYNMWGNREYNSALSIAPFVKFPTNTLDDMYMGFGGETAFRNDAVEFGIKAPFALELKEEFTFGAMIEVDVFEDVTDRDGYHFELVNSVSLSRPVIDAFAAYVEYYSRNTLEDDRPWIAIFAFGGVFAAYENLLLDATVRVGLSEAAEDIRAGVGGSYRF